MVTAGAVVSPLGAIGSSVVGVLITHVSLDSSVCLYYILCVV